MQWHVHTVVPLCTVVCFIWSLLFVNYKKLQNHRNMTSRQVNTEKIVTTYTVNRKKHAKMFFIYSLENPTDCDKI